MGSTPTLATFLSLLLFENIFLANMDNGETTSSQDKVVDTPPNDSFKKNVYNVNMRLYHLKNTKVNEILCYTACKAG